MILAFFLACYLSALPAADEGLGESRDVYQQFCDRADECNLLEGMSVTECVEDYRDAVQDCTGTAEEDWEADVLDCIEENDDDCGDWEACLYESYTWGCWDE